MILDLLRQRIFPIRAVSSVSLPHTVYHHTFFVRFGINNSESQQLNKAIILIITLLDRKGSKASMQYRLTRCINPVHSDSGTPYSLRIGGYRGLNRGTKTSKFVIVLTLIFVGSATGV